jgi:hypothetical protein
MYIYSLYKYLQNFRMPVENAASKSKSKSESESELSGVSNSVQTRKAAGGRFVARSPPNAHLTMHHLAHK